MVQPQYSPQEALQRVKLMMKYDTSKTLNENKEIIFEQVEACTPSLSEADLNTIIEEVYNKLDLLTTWGLQAYYVEERAKSVYENINKLVGKRYYDDITKECKIAKTEFIEQFKNRAYKGGLMFSTNGDIIEVIDEALDEDGVKATPRAQKYLNVAKTILTTEEVIPVKPEEPKPKEEKDCTQDPNQEKCKTKKKTSSGGGFIACTGTYKKGCMSNEIKKVQGCLGGLVTDGKYGPNTDTKLKQLGYSTHFTDADIDKICGKTQTVVDNDIDLDVEVKNPSQQ